MRDNIVFDVPPPRGVYSGPRLHGLDYSPMDVPILQEENFSNFERCNEEIISLIDDVAKNCINSIANFYELTKCNHLYIKYIINNYSDCFALKKCLNDDLLFKACENGNYNLVKYLVEQKNLDIQKSYTRKKEELYFLPDMCHSGHSWRFIENITALHLACEGGNIELVKYLIDDMKLDVSAVDYFRSSVLHYACKSGNLELVKYLIEKHSLDVHAYGTNKQTILHFAYMSGNIELVKYLIDVQKVEVNRIRIDDSTSLHLACEMGNLEIVRYLVENHNLDIKITAGMDSSILISACKSGNLVLVKYLIEDKKILEWIENERFVDNSSVGEGKAGKYYNLFLAACKGGNLNLIKYLVEDRGIIISDCEPKDDSIYWNACGIDDRQDKKSIIDCASETGNLELVRYLIENMGLEPNIPPPANSMFIGSDRRFTTSNPLKSNVLNNACKSGNVSLVKYLIEEIGMDVNSFNEKSGSILHSAIDSGSLELVKYLIEEAKVDITGPNIHEIKTSSKGFWTLYKALSNKNPQILEYLVTKRELKASRKNPGPCDPKFLHPYGPNNNLDVANFLERMESIRRRLIPNNCPKCIIL